MTSILADLLTRNNTDPRVRLELAPDFLLAVQNGHIESRDSLLMTQFIEAMVQWLNGSNFKVALEAIEILDVCLDQAGSDLLPYYLDNSTVFMERLGDSKEQVRDCALALIVKMMCTPGCSPQIVLDRMTAGFTHKQWLVRRGLLVVLQEALRNFGTGSLQLSKVTPLVCKLVADANIQVRDAAVETLVEMYIHLGDKLAGDIQKRHLIPDSKASAVFARFEEAKKSGLVQNSAGADYADRAAPTNVRNASAGLESRSRVEKKVVEESKSVPGKRASSVPAKRVLMPTLKTAAIRRSGSGNSGEGANAGALDEQDFCQAFEDVPKVQFYSAKELTILMDQIRETLSDANNDWDKRVDALKRLRSLVLAGAPNYDEFYTNLRALEVPFQLAAKDLRSQVVREAAITISYLSETLQTKMDHFAETVFHVLINQIQSSAKIMSTSGMVACRFLLKNTHAPRLIPVLTSNMSSKSKDIRRECCGFLSLVLDTWETYNMERFVTALSEAIRQGLNDADEGARRYSRQAYGGFQKHFPDQAELLLQSLDPSKQRQLMGELSGSASSSSLVVGARPSLRKSQESLLSRGGLGTGIPSLSRDVYTSNRSTSDIDPGAARRALQRRMISGRGVREAPMAAVHAAPVQHSQSTDQNSLPHAPAAVAGNSRSVSSRRYYPFVTNGHSSSHVGTRSTSRPTSKSVSQPGSRSSSPSSRFALTGRRPAPGTRIAAPTRSQGGSREQSPTRTRRMSTESSSSPYSTHTQGSTLGQRYLSYTMEQQVAEALRARKSSKDEGDSETSSVCSERGAAASDLAEVLKLCASIQWTERKEGLLRLQQMCANRRPFTPTELKRTSDILNRIFVDPHNKVYSLFVDTMLDFVLAFREELTDCLYMLLARLLMKLGQDVRSVQTKLYQLMDTLVNIFAPGVLYANLLRYLLDPAQTMGSKVKTEYLRFLHMVVEHGESGMIVNSADQRRALNKIIDWLTDQRTLSDTRKYCQIVLVAMFNLNTSEFTAMLQTMPKHFQDTVYMLLQSHMQYQTSNASRPQPSARRSVDHHTSNAAYNVQDVHTSLRETSAEIQKYSFATAEAGGGSSGSKDSGIVDAVEYNRDYNGFNGNVDVLSPSTEEERQEEMISDILSELSNHNRRVQERLKAMNSLKYMTRDGSFSLWDEHFKTILLIFLETLGDDNKDIRGNALRVLKEICLCQGARFKEYAELTILKVLEAQRDPEKDVVRFAEECATVLGTHLPPRICLRVLNPILQSEDNAAFLPAVKMATKVIEKLSQEEVQSMLPDIVPGVIKAFEESQDSSVRKASVMCLVTIFLAAGETAMHPYMEALTSSKVKLLQVYVKKAMGLPSPK